MKRNWREWICTAVCIGGLGAAGLVGGCVMHGHDHEQMDIVDTHGYHHTGYYDEHHDWHGGYYDEQHGWHDDPHDWHE